jgi:hypothetical protein
MIKVRYKEIKKKEKDNNKVFRSERSIKWRANSWQEISQSRGEGC